MSGDEGVREEDILRANIQGELNAVKERHQSELERTKEELENELKAKHESEIEELRANIADLKAKANPKAQAAPYNSPAELLKSEAPSEVVMSRSDFFADLKEMLRGRLDALEEAIESRQKKQAESDASTIRLLHGDVVSAVEHISQLVQSQILDARYLLVPPGPDAYDLAHKCEYVSNRPLSDALLEAMKVQFGVDAGAVVETVKCGGSPGSMWEKLKKSSAGYFWVEACPYHRYQTENLHYVTQLSRTGIAIELENEERDGYMYYYLLKRGL